MEAFRLLGFRVEVFLVGVDALVGGLVGQGVGIVDEDLLDMFEVEEARPVDVLVDRPGGRQINRFGSALPLLRPLRVAVGRNAHERSEISARMLTDGANGFALRPGKGILYDNAVKVMSVLHVFGIERVTSRELRGGDDE